MIISTTFTENNIWITMDESVVVQCIAIPNEDNFGLTS